MEKKELIWHWKNVPDIIVCDVMMPEKDGFNVCRELKEDFAQIISRLFC